MCVLLVEQFSAEIVDNESYTFDGTGCALMFKKARSVYGPFFDSW
jgi:hypothetical protein